MVKLDPSVKARLNWRMKEHYPSDSLFDRIARAVCDAGCLPRKELYESWEVARRLRRRCKGGRIVDIAAGHGLLGYICLLLDDSSPNALSIDPRKPPCANAIAEALESAWPRLKGRIQYHEQPLEEVQLYTEDIVVSAHACGTLTDWVLQRALDVRARVAVLPCCHDLKQCDTGGLEGWLDSSLAIDAVRAIRLREAGYHTYTQAIPDAITPKNRLLLGIPQEWNE